MEATPEPRTRSTAGQPPAPPLRPTRTTGTRSGPTSDTATSGRGTRPTRRRELPTAAGNPRQQPAYGHDPDDLSAYYDDIFDPDAHDTTGQTFDDYLFNLDPDVLAALDPDKDHYMDGYWTNIEPDADFLEEYRWAAT